MGKTTGFIEYPRQGPAARDPRERVRDFDEFLLPLPRAELERQGARCMDCGIPFCHTGGVLGGMATGCPVNNLVPEWNDLVFRGRWREALERLHATNNFPEFTGRVCPAPCEGSCVLGIDQPPVTIKSLENAIADRGFAEGWIVPEPPAERSGRTVAVIGSGPAGLACAAQLNRAGHSVTVFERDDRPGGLLMYGIPNMKLDKELVLRRIRQMEDEGVRFVTGVEIGKDRPAKQLLAEFDAVVLCTGATRARDLDVPGRTLRGVHFAMEFLHDATRHVMQVKAGVAAAPPSPSAAGKRVVVIGGGDTGTDCVGTALRQGCSELVQLEILPRPPEIRGTSNAWPQYPRTYKLDYGQEEASAIHGADPRVYSVSSVELLEEDGKVTGVKTCEIRWERDAAGRMAMLPVSGTDRVIGADLVLLAMGFLGPEEGIALELGVALDPRMNFRADETTYQTSVPGVFTAGDCRRGQSLVVWAIREGREAAAACDRHLRASPASSP